MKRYALFFIAIIILIILIYVVVVHISITSTAIKEPPHNINYVIVLGAKIRGEELSLSLYNRVTKALEYLNDNPKSNVIVSGGQGQGESITEAEAMERYFVENGIEKDRIIKEEKSTSTFENIKFSKELLDGETEVVIVSNDFHLYRATIIAKRFGLVPHTLAAETPTIVKAQLWLREYVAVAKTLLFDRE